MPKKENQRCQLRCRQGNITHIFTIDRFNNVTAKIEIIKSMNQYSLPICNIGGALQHQIGSYIHLGVCIIKIVNFQRTYEELHTIQCMQSLKYELLE